MYVMYLWNKVIFIDLFIGRWYLKMFFKKDFLLFLCNNIVDCNVFVVILLWLGYFVMVYICYSMVSCKMLILILVINKWGLDFIFFFNFVRYFNFL